MEQKEIEYLDSLTKDELLRERAITNSLILPRLYSPPPVGLSQQEKEEYIKENKRLIDRKNYIRRRLLYLSSTDLLNTLAPVIKRPLNNETSKK